MAANEEQTKPEFNQTSANIEHTEPNLSRTKPLLSDESGLSRNKGGRPRKAPDVIPWTVRGVDQETRTAIEKAASRSSKTIGQYMNEDVRQYAQEQLKKGNQVPIRQEEIRVELDEIKSMITQLASRMPDQDKKGFFKRLFG